MDDGVEVAVQKRRRVLRLVRTCGLALVLGAAALVVGIWWPVVAFVVGVVVIAAVWDYRNAHRRSGAWVSPPGGSMVPDGGYVVTSQGDTAVDPTGRTWSESGKQPTAEQVAASGSPSGMSRVLVESAVFVVAAALLIWAAAARLG